MPGPPSTKRLLCLQDVNELIDETRVESLLEKVEVVQDVDSYQRYTCKYIADQSRQHFILDSAATVKTKVKTDSCRQSSILLTNKMLVGLLSIMDPCDSSN